MGKLCTDIESTSDTSKFIKRFSKNEGTIGLLKKEDESYTQSAEETLGLLTETHFPNAIEIESLDKEIPPSKPWVIKNHKTRMVKTKYIKQILKSFGPDKAAGKDNLTPRTLQHLPDCILDILCHLYKCALANGYSPKIWREMNAIFIPKQGKDCYNTPKSFRPITLSNFILKVLEKLVQRSITGNILDNPLYNQHGFTKGKSCDSALSEVGQLVESAIFRRHSALTVFLDITGAFDNVKFDSVKKIMEKRNISQTIVSWYDHLLRNRIVTCSLLNCTKSFQPQQGTPQGGVLSAVIWNLVNQSLLNKFKKGPNCPVGLADDTTLTNNKGSIPSMIRQMQKALNKVYEWGLEEGLTFNPSKTAVLLFSQKTSIKRDELKKLQLGGIELPYLKEVKYLGITFTDRLTWHKHIMQKIASCKKLLMMLRHSVDKEWGLSPDKMLWIWQTIVRPKLTYGCLLWSDASILNNSSIRSSLNQLQRLALSLTTSAMKSTPSKTLEIILGVMPLPLFIKETAAMTRIRTKEVVNMKWDNKTHLVRQGHMLDSDNTINKAFPEGVEIDRTFAINPVKINTDISGEANIQPKGISVYTDGSVKHDQAGTGWVISTENTPLLEGRSALCENLSAFQAEIIAIDQAARHLITACTKNKKIFFFTDSQSAINALEYWSICSKTALKCAETLAELKNNKNMIQFNWVKSHSDNPLNDLADKLARQGRSTQGSTSVKQPISSDIIKKKIHHNIMNEWQEQINDASISHTKSLVTKINRSKIYKQNISRLSRSQINTVVAWISGHCKLKHHQNRIGNEPDNKCRLCNSHAETPYHVLRKCPGTLEIRNEMENSYSSSRYKSKHFSWSRTWSETDFKCSAITSDLIHYILHVHLETLNKLPDNHD
jgi:ribonuclease HI